MYPIYTTFLQYTLCFFCRISLCQKLTDTQNSLTGPADISLASFQAEPWAQTRELTDHIWYLYLHGCFLAASPMRVYILILISSVLHIMFNFFLSRVSIHYVYCKLRFTVEVEYFFSWILQPTEVHKELQNSLMSFGVMGFMILSPWSVLFFCTCASSDFYQFFYVCTTVEYVLMSVTRHSGWPQQNQILSNIQL